MLIVTATHLLWVIRHGLLSEAYQTPFLSMLFWDSLIVLDPMAALLLIAMPRIGIWFTAFIIVVDVLLNGTICLLSLFMSSTLVTTWIIGNWMLWCQLAFAAFVLLSFKTNRKEILLWSK